MKDRHKRFHILTGGLAVLCLLLSGYLFVCEKTDDKVGQPVWEVVYQKTDTESVATEDMGTEVNVKRIALTFDDGPHPVYTPILLEGLEKRDVKVSFFLLGTAVEKYPEIVEEMSAQGHLIGNHTYHHVSLEHADTRTIESEVISSNELIEEISGQYPQFLRPPFGHYSEQLENQTGMICVMWNVDPLDWCTTDASVVVERVLDHARDDCIILLHDQYKSSVMAAFTIIDELQKQGYEFVTVDELVLD